MSKSALIATLLSPFARFRRYEDEWDGWEENPSPRPWVDPLTPEQRERWRRAGKEVDDNARVFFDELLDDLIAGGHKGKSALMRGGKVVEILDNYRVAKARGMELFPGIDEHFSIQEITDEPLCMGMAGAWIADASDNKKPAAT
ncbi:MAG: hypothetical protein MPJ79_02990 [Alphaproteobacteria bacterium]|nr:hypothetical protein [Alphaproteobacteria bacterium]MDA7988885.1 hypothetical protein [Alphaproteobacteria bacterium]